MTDFNIDVPGLPQYLAAKQALMKTQRDEQAQGLQQQFQQERANLGANPTPEALIGLAQKYASPIDLLHYGQASLDRREATAQRLQQGHELAQYRIDNLQRQRDADLARVRSEEGRQALKKSYDEQMLALRQFQAQSADELKRLGVQIQQQNADTNARRVDQTINKADEPLQNMLDKIDSTTRMIQANPEAVGGRGMLGRGTEFLGSLVNPGQETPASNLQTQILDLQNTYRGLPGFHASRLKMDAANVDKLIKGLGAFTTADQALGSLGTLREAVARQLQRRGSEETPPTIVPAPTDPQKRQANTVYQTPRGPLLWSGTGWRPVPSK